MRAGLSASRLKVPDAERRAVEAVAAWRGVAGSLDPHASRSGSSAFNSPAVVNAALKARQNLPRAARIDRARRAPASAKIDAISICYRRWHGARIVLPVAARALGDARDLSNGELRS